MYTAPTISKYNKHELKSTSKSTHKSVASVILNEQKSNSKEKKFRTIFGTSEIQITGIYIEYEKKNCAMLGCFLLLEISFLANNKNELVPLVKMNTRRKKQSIQFSNDVNETKDNFIKQFAP